MKCLRLYIIITILLTCINTTKSQVIDCTNKNEKPFWTEDNYITPPKTNDKGVINVTMFKQCNSDWGDDQLGFCTTKTICSHGCAITSVAMIMKTAGINVNPGDLNQWLIDYTNDGNNGYDGCNIY